MPNLKTRRHSNRNYWPDQYSHLFAKHTYKKKAPKDLYQQVVAYLKERKNHKLSHWQNNFTIEDMCMKLKVLHKYAHGVIQQLERRGAVRKNFEDKFQSPAAPGNVHRQPGYINDAMHDGARHPKIYSIIHEKL